MRISLPILLTLLLSGAAVSAETVDERVLRAGDTELRIAVVGVEDRARADLLHRWAAEAARATLTVSGRFPLKTSRARISQRASRDPSAVPWGQTSRRGEVSVLLYVRPDATLEELRADWTAVHEFSHLFHPYLGDRGRWLAEGLASYYQNVLRARAGLLDADEAWRRLDGGFARGRAATSADDVRLDALGRRRGATMRVYWAGAAFWLEADLALRREHKRSLDDVLDAHAACCLSGTAWVQPQDFMAALDRAGGDGIFGDLYSRYAASTAFPTLDPAYAALGIGKTGTTLRFSRDADVTRLRAAIMGPRRQSGSL